MLEIVNKSLQAIKPVSSSRLKTAQSHLNSLTKPPGSLGLLEELAKRYVAIRGNALINRKAVMEERRSMYWPDIRMPIYWW